MNQILTISKRELKSNFDSLLAYIMLILFLGATGFFTWLYSGSNIFFRKQASLEVFFEICFFSLFFFIPTLTMRSIAEEKHSGTIEIILTKPVNEWQMVMGKYLSIMILMAIALALTLPYYFTVSSLGDVDHGVIWTGYFGLILMSSAYAAIGIFASSISNNQIVSVLLALFITVFFHFIFGMISSTMSGFLGEIFNFLSTRTHYDSITRGVIDSKDIIYFASLTFLGLFGTELMIAKRNLN